MSAIIIQASYASTCPFSGEKIKPGDAICQYTMEQHRAYIEKEGKKKLALRARLIGRWGKREHVDFQTSTTRYGRRVQRPATEGTRKFVKGSRVAYADHYDRNYCHGVCFEADSSDTEPTETEDPFIVKDVDSDASSEEEYESGSDQTELESTEEEDSDDQEEEDSDEDTSDVESEWEESEDDDDSASDVSSLTDYERPFKWAWEDDDELHKPDAERDDMFCDVEPSEELLHKGETFTWEDDEGYRWSTLGGVRDVKLRNGDVFTVIDETDLVLDEYRMPVGQLYMDHLGVYNIHQGEGPCDG